MKPHIRFDSRLRLYKCAGAGSVALNQEHVIRYGLTPKLAYLRWRESAGYPRDPNRNAWTGSEPYALQSETATNALHQHQPAPAPKDWKTRVSEFLKRLVHNHPSR